MEDNIKIQTVAVRIMHCFEGLTINEVEQVFMIINDTIDKLNEQDIEDKDDYKS